MHLRPLLEPLFATLQGDLLLVSVPCSYAYNVSASGAIHSEEDSREDILSATIKVKEELKE
jgi:hypothetical protein